MGSIILFSGLFLIVYRYNNVDSYANNIAGDSNINFRNLKLLEVSEKMFRVRDTSSNKMGYINEDRKVVIPFIYDFIGVFENDLVEAEFEGKCGFLNKLGDVVIHIEYKACGYFNEDYAPVQKEGKWGFINKKGKPFTPFIYDEISIFKDGLGPVGRKNKWGFVNSEGVEIIQINYDLDNC